MKIKLEVELDSDKQEDLELIEDVLYHIQAIKEILETRQQNLNKRTNTKKKVMQ